MKKFFELAVSPQNENYEKLVERKGELYSFDEIRSPFDRDYTRILHCTAFRRLKHKTQVFYNIANDHICTRLEHVLHVESVSNTISRYLGLNEDLTRAISVGHDIGHAPFGHYGETVIDQLSKQYLNKPFYHENNGLYFADNIELLPDHNNNLHNLSLTYAVRDGIVAHCGENDINTLFPRKEFYDLGKFKRGDNPITFEGCVVKISDKIAYVGRDIEDALTLGFLTKENLDELSKIADIKDDQAINTSSIMSETIKDICKSSSPNDGICLSQKSSEFLNEIKRFNYKYIYGNDKFEPYKKYAKLVITEIFEVLMQMFDQTPLKLIENLKYTKLYPKLMTEFYNYLTKYCLIVGEKTLLNKKIYGNLERENYCQAVIDFVAGMTDRFAVEGFNCLITY